MHWFRTLLGPHWQFKPGPFGPPAHRLPRLRFSSPALSLSRARPSLVVRVTVPVCTDDARFDSGQRDRRSCGHSEGRAFKSRSTRPQLSTGFVEAGPQLRRGSGSPNLPAKTFLRRSLAKALCVWGENSKSLSHPPSWCKLNRLKRGCDCIRNEKNLFRAIEDAPSLSNYYNCVSTKPHPKSEEWIRQKLRLCCEGSTLGV
jgi:hypothetical protein